jgi:hypothetical protein
MTRVKFARLFVFLGVLTVTLLLTQAATARPADPGTDYPPGSYQNPEWAPQWFKDCTDYKSWADWGFNSYIPAHPDDEGWNWNFARLSPTASPSGAAVYASTVQGRTGVISGGVGDGFSVWMDNEVMDYTKQVWFQFDVWTDAADLNGMLTLSDPTITDLSPLTFTTSEPLNGWRTVTAYWEIPQPDWEQVNFLFGAAGNTFAVDSVRMATQCPEPGTIIMLVMAGLAGLIYKYRRMK